MKADNSNIEGLFSQASFQYIIPALQRRYVWGKSNWEGLWKSVSGFHSSFKTDYSASCFLGAVVLVNKSDNQVNCEKYVIDGQQRLTTFAILLASIATVAKEIGDGIVASNVERLLQRHGRGEAELCKLVTRNEDREPLRAVILGKEISPGAIRDAYGYFHNQIKRYIKELPVEQQSAELQAFLNTVVSGVRFVVITMDANEDAWGVFRSLNATGVPLAPSDLIRNFVFEKCNQFDDQNSFDVEHWRPIEGQFKGKTSQASSEAFTAFMRSMMMVEDGKHFKPAETFFQFENRYHGSSPYEIAKKLADFAEPYKLAEAAVTRGRLPVDLSPKLLEALMRFGDLVMGKSVIPLVAKILSNIGNNKQKEAEAIRSLYLLESFIVRRAICGQPAKWYDVWFPKAATHAGSYSEFRDHLVGGEGNRFPDDAAFLHALETGNLYKNKYQLHILARIEGYLDPRDDYSRIKASVEHIMPQTIDGPHSEAWIEALGGPAVARIHHQELLHTLGNLTLLPPRKNSEKKNSPFKDAVPVYQGCKYEITRRVAARPSWNPGEIKNRSKELAKIGLEIWTRD